MKKYVYIDKFMYENFVPFLSAQTYKQLVYIVDGIVKKIVLVIEKKIE